ncbi:MAG: NAD-dependent epimerase/dehydratase family protein, partial [Gammaproteobacteria bacterium]
MSNPISRDSRIFVAGHRGMAGSALMRRLQRGGYRNLVTRTRQELDLLDSAVVARFMREARPDYVFLAAAKVGGIFANDT